MHSKELYYGDYLHLKQILNAQDLVSEQHGQRAHDEMFFIILHQTFELWFKEILVELESVRALFAEKAFTDGILFTIIARLTRITAVQKLLLQQLNLLETLTPSSFLEFRDFLNPSSGFQSVQFRLLQMRMGANIDDDTFAIYLKYLNAADKKRAQDERKQKSLFTYVEEWLQRLPLLKTKEFDFLAGYEAGLARYINDDEKGLCSQHLSQQHIKQHHEQINLNQGHFASLFSRATYEKSRADWPRRLNYDAVVSALFIEVYQEQPLLQMPYQLLQRLIEMDELFTDWRFQHAMMVHRMIGVKTGTIGSLGYTYLKGTIDKYCIFGDLANVATYLLPKQYIPDLPAEVVKKLGFYFNSK
jgi:tryptophan 2,3-dioxygenase